MNKLDIDFYYDGYKTSEINCIDLPLAACAGYYNRENYFYYCMCYNFLLNWNLYFEEDWYFIRKSILGYLKIDFFSKNIIHEEELLDNIILCLNNDNPILLIVKYASLFYSKYYKFGTYDHGIIISDYDNSNNTFGIRDREVVRDHINAGIFSSDIMHRIQLDCENVKKIWLYSNKLFDKENSVHKQLYYYLNVDENYNINPKKLIQTFLKEDDKISNQFECYVINLQKRIKNRILIQQAELENVRRIFFKSFFVFRDVVQKHILANNYKLEKNNEFHEKFNEFINNRLLIIDRVQRNALKNKVITSNEVKGLFEYDTELFIKLKNEILSML